MQIEIKKYSCLTVYEDSVEDVILCSDKRQDYPKVIGVVLGR